jgi:magnesium chelatase subunit I
VDIDAVEDFVLRHRRRQQAPQAPAATPPERPQAQQSEQPPQQGEGQWGELPAQVQAMGERRVPPRWTKKP